MRKIEDESGEEHGQVVEGTADAFNKAVAEHDEEVADSEDEGQQFEIAQVDDED